ncbi:hypothetical protein C8Q76DRAFT_793505 [Earliella scabrosa]|nr:hypothetical protein C8Q76DRAFT_793505 [Earliella scabrosa]
MPTLPVLQERPSRPDGSAGPSNRPSSRFGNDNSGKAKSAALQLSEKEKADLIAAGQCFLCRQTGHVQRNCPKNNRVQSNRKGAPPGLSNFNIEFNLEGAERLRTLAQSTARIDELELSSLEFAWTGLPREHEDRDDNSSTGMPDLFTPEPSTVESIESEDDDTLGIDQFSDDEVLEGDPLELYNLLVTAWYEQHARAMASSHGTGSGQELTSNSDGSFSCGPELEPALDPIEVDENAEGALASLDNFLIEPDVDDTYLVWTMMGFDDTPVLNGRWLRDPEFDIADWFRGLVFAEFGSCAAALEPGLTGDVLAEGAAAILEVGCPYPDGFESDEARFRTVQCSRNVFVTDTYLGLDGLCPNELLAREQFNLVDWHARHARAAIMGPPFVFDDLEGELVCLLDGPKLSNAPDVFLELNAVGGGGALPLAALQRNALSPRYFRRLIPEPVVVVVEINGHPARTLLDSGSLSDFMSTKLAHQLGIPTVELAKPMLVHLAAQGSRVNVSSGCKAQLAYQNIKESRYFDIMNLLNYDLILGTPFLFQHRVTLGLNPTAVMVGSAISVPIEGKQVCVLESRAAEMYEENLEAARQHLRDYAKDIYTDAVNASITPYR